jgi:hypothetical protein
VTKRQENLFSAVEIAKTVVDTVIRKSSPTTKERGTKEMSEMASLFTCLKTYYDIKL